MMDIVAGVIFGAIMLAGLAILFGLAPDLPPIDTDEDGRPTDRHEFYQAIYDARQAFKELGTGIADHLENETPIGRLAAWVERKVWP